MMVREGTNLPTFTNHVKVMVCCSVLKQFNKKPPTTAPLQTIHTNHQGSVFGNSWQCETATAFLSMAAIL